MFFLSCVVVIRIKITVRIYIGESRLRCTRSPGTSEGTHESTDSTGVTHTAPADSGGKSRALKLVGSFAQGQAWSLISRLFDFISGVYFLLEHHYTS